MSIIVLVSGLALLAIVFVGPQVCHWRTRHLGYMADFQDHFFKSASALLEDDDTPLAVVERLEHMANWMAKPRVGRVLFYSALSGDLARLAKNKSADEIDHIVQKMRPELRAQFGVANVAAIFALTYTNVICGPIMRRVILFNTTEQKPEQAERIVEVTNHRQCADGAPA